MCGIGGGIDLSRSTRADELENHARRMTSSLRHRGPDGSGTFVDASSGVFLSHTRLAIQDLSPRGSQPMHSPTGNLVVSFNGEIYNHLRLRKELSSQFIGGSDTETLLVAIEEWGLEAALERIDGMFAFAILNRRERRLTLVRDRLGEKPLYYGVFGEHVLFASELPALEQDHWFDSTIDNEALAEYFRFGFVPAPRSIFRDVRKLAPGSIATFDLAAGHQDSARIEQYWSLAPEVGRELSRPGVDRMRVSESVELGLEALRASVQDRLLADVPVGVFLSSGVDSAIVAALAAESGADPTAYTVEFPGSVLDESADAAATAQHLGIRHERIPVGQEDIVQLAPKIAEISGEPFADSSILPTYQLSLAVSGRTKVVLSGDGADEIFGGYRRYRIASQGWKRLWWSQSPPNRRRVATAASRLDELVSRLPSSTLSQDRVLTIRQKMLGLLDSGCELEGYSFLASVWPDVVDGRSATVLPDGEKADWLLEDLERAMLLDQCRTLPDQMMAKVDRSSMAHALEVRLPLASVGVAELAWSLPRQIHLGAAGEKSYLRIIGRTLLGSEIVDRPKRGFDPPLGEWLRGELKVWAEDLLRDPLVDQLPVDGDRIRRLWTDHQSHRVDAFDRIWAVLMYISWFRGRPSRSTNTAS